LAHLVPSARQQLMDRAWEVAVNRERAGLHYRSDTVAGKSLAERVFAILTTECELFRTTLEKAMAAEWRKDVADDWVQEQQTRTRNHLNRDSLIDDIARRATDLSPKNPPMRFHFRGGELFLRDGSLFLKSPRGRDDDEKLIVGGGAVA